VTDSGSDQHGSGEQDPGRHGPGEHSLGEHSLGEHSLDEPVADQIEQQQEAVPDAAEPGESDLPVRVPLEADEADAAEQAREVATGEDEYR